MWLRPNINDLSDWRSFLALLHDERFLGVRELRSFHAKPFRLAKDNCGKKLQFQMIQISGGRAPEIGSQLHGKKTSSSTLISII
jgi:hypothetical protein